jgi:hypothetical protein
MARLICNSEDNRDSIECSACGKDHSEYVMDCPHCKVRQRVNMNRPATCCRCGKGLDTSGGAAE